MDDVKSAIDHDQQKSKKTAKKVTVTFTYGTVAKIIIALAIAGVLVGVFLLGEHRGSNQQKAANPLSAFNNANRNVTPGRRWSAIGKVTEVSENLVKIKDSRGKEQQAAINKDTVVTGSDGKKTDWKAIKKDQRVISTGTKDDKGAQTATRIRIEK